MLKAILAVSVLVPSLVTATAAPATVPLLSGKYVYTVRTFCQITVTAKSAADTGTGGNAVTAITMSKDPDKTYENLEGGSATLTQGDVAGSGTVSVSGTDVEGSAIALSNSGTENGTTGEAPRSHTYSGGGAFSQTATTLTLPGGSSGTTFNAYYGQVSGGIAQFATANGVNSDGCIEQYTFTHA